jgi:prevent-host-death family protein
MKRSYSLYEAKARLSEIIRQVREHGVGVTISYHGRPVAEIRPIAGEATDPVEARFRELLQSGVLSAPHARGELKPIARRPGALERFLAERD